MPDTLWSSYKNNNIFYKSKLYYCSYNVLIERSDFYKGPYMQCVFKKSEMLVLSLLQANN